jgi:dCMP deaminase
MERAGKDEYYIGIADAVLARSTCLRRKYGAVIVKNDEIIATGYNGASRGRPNCTVLGYCERERLDVPSGQRYELCVAVHAEQNAVISAARRDMLDGTVYIAGRDAKDGSFVCGMPCMICRRMLENAGIKRVVIRQADGTIKEIGICAICEEI